MVLEAARFVEKLESADLVLTGEGCLDEQTLRGKTISGVTRAARMAKGGAGVPVIAFAGAVKLNEAQIAQLGLLAAHALSTQAMTLEESIANAASLLEIAVERALK